jgi:hypothetical protein
MKQFKLVGSYSPVDQGVNGGQCRSENTRLISIKPMHDCSIDGCDELHAGKLPICTFGAVTQTHEGPDVIAMNQYAKSRQEEKTIHLPAELEDYDCVVSNTLMKLESHQGNIKLCGFAIPIWHKNDLMKIPMYRLTDKEWKEPSHAILSRDQPWDSKQDRELNQDHIAHRTKVANGMTHITPSERRFDDQGQDRHRNKYAMQNRTTVHQVICHNVPRQDLDNLMYTMDLSNISLNPMGERTVSDQQD